VSRSVCKNAAAAANVSHLLLDGPAPAAPDDEGEEDADKPSEFRNFRNVRSFWHNICVKRDMAMGKHINPGTKQYWKDVNLEFDELSKEDADEIHAKMEREGQACRSRKLYKKALCDSTITPSSLVPVDGSSDSMSYKTLLHEHTSSTTSPTPPRRSRQGELIPVPIDVVDSYHEMMQKLNGLSGVKAVSTDRTQRVRHEVFARDNGAVPSRVLVPLRCGPICRTDARRAACEILTKQVMAFHNTWGDQESARRLEILIGFECLGGVEPYTLFALFVDIIGNGVDGVFVPSLVFLQVKPIAGSAAANRPYTDVILDFAEHPHVACHRKPNTAKFIDGVTHGRWIYLLVDTMAEALLPTGRRVDRVSCHELNFTWVPGTL